MNLLLIFTFVISKITFYVNYFFFAAKYYCLGGASLIEDFISKKENVFDPFSKSGEIAVVTGGARGIGAELVKKLLQCDMHVIIGCRNVKAGLAWTEDIRKQGVSSGTVSVLELDLASFSSIKKFADTVVKSVSCLHLLVNNAGIMFPPYEETKSGFESQWAVNYLGHFLLTHHLLSLLQSGSINRKTRIVNVSSCAHHAALPISFEDINMKNNYIPSAAYAQSKLAQVLYTKELDRTLKTNGDDIDVFAVHPGIVDTDIFNGTFLKKVFPWILKYMFKDIEKGATTVLFSCISPTLDGKGGNYISNCKFYEPSALAKDTDLQRKLFNYTMQTLNIKEFGKLD